jgi:hypothetical protein
MRVLVSALIVCLLAWSSAHANADVEKCVARGIAYFKEIGSYPMLHTHPNKGRRAEVVARERCNRTTTAF